MWKQTQKESVIQGISRQSTRQVLSSPARFLTSRVDLVPHFSRLYVGKQEILVNICHINVPKKNPPTFKNYNSGSIFNKKLQQSNRSTS